MYVAVGLVEWNFDSNYMNRAQSLGMLHPHYRLRLRRGPLCVRMSAQCVS
jgi:hypothetical protein